MLCSFCNVEMEEVDVLNDYYDPGDEYGHRQSQYVEFVCPKCHIKIMEHQDDQIDED